MRKFYLLIVLICIANLINAQTNYNKLWKEVETFTDKGLPQSALQTVNKIYTLAVKENNPGHQIKAAIYKLNLSFGINNNSIESLSSVDSLIAKSKPPVQNIFYSLKANIISSFSRGYRFQNRTPLQNETGESIDSWSNEKIKTETINAFRNSLNNTQLLQSIDLKDYTPALIKGNTSQYNSLYDLLALRALNYFKEKSFFEKKSANSFNLNNALFFSSSDIFISLKLPLEDSTSKELNALKTFISLLTLHNGADGIDLDIDRLEYVFLNSNIENKDSLYVNALEKIYKKFEGNPATSRVSYKLASYYFNNNNPLKAKQILASAVQSADIKNLLSTIESPDLNIQLERVYTPGPLKALVNYKNIDKVFFKVIKTSNEFISELTQSGSEDVLKKLNSLNILNQWNQPLPDPKDYKEHSAEIKIDKLSAGVYILISSIKNNLAEGKNIVNYNIFHVSNLAYIQNQNEFYVLDRSSGNPLPGVSAEVIQRKYDPKTRKYLFNSKAIYASDNNGYFKVNFQNNEQFLIKLKSKTEELFLLQDFIYSYSINNLLRPKTFSSILYTDRAIYRPGQKIYFKGIIYSSSKEGIPTEIAANHKVKLDLYDANHQKIASENFTTNSFGSYTGSFVLPSGSLTGMFYLKDSATNNVKFFNVEEYKRPQFKVEINLPEQEYKINDTINVSGNVMAFAGYNLAGANVSYRVIRNSYFPVWRTYLKILPVSPPFEITNGFTTTDANGNFKISFKAIPDNHNSNEVYSYEVIADVTDINGETQSNSKSISVSDKPFEITISAPQEINSFDSIKVKTETINGVFVNNQIKLKIEKLSPQVKIYKPRLWQKPDQFVMTKSEFEKYFPNDPYSDEDDISNRKIEKIIVEKSVKTSADGKVNINFQPSEEGWYKISATSVDSDVSGVKYVYVNLEKSKTEKPVSISTPDKNFEPGQQSIVKINSAFNNAYTIITYVRPDTSISQTKMLEGKIEESKININENDRGGIIVNAVILKNNRLYSSSTKINVPWNKDLKIELQTFRNKVLPGTKENWKLKITGSKSAEVLVNMYDKSLDAFKENIFEKISSLFPETNNSARWKLQGNEVSLSENIAYYNIEFLPSSQLIYPQLIPLEVGYIRHRFELAAVAKNQNIVEEVSDSSMEKKEDIIDVVIRKNFNETAFFYPQLSTDGDGNIKFEFNAPEALTQWKLMILAHDKFLSSAYAEEIITTQKPLMVQPNFPRFLRQNDRIELPVKVTNIDAPEISGTVTLELSDALTGKNIDGLFANSIPAQHFSLSPKQSNVLFFPVQIPSNFTGILQYKVVASSTSSQISDGEQNLLPVVTNKTLVTETYPFTIKDNSEKKLTINGLINSKSSPTLKNERLTVEFTANPSWYVIQALPYLEEIKYKSADSYFNAFFSNALGYKIISSNAEIEKIIRSWQNNDSSMLFSQLAKNEELKSVLLNETPWVLNSQDETNQKKNISNFFNPEKLLDTQQVFLNILKSYQTSNGGFSWFPNSPDNRYITNYIITGIGKLSFAGINNSEFSTISASGIKYLDDRIYEDYFKLKKQKNVDLSKDNLSATAIEYLYMRSFYKNTGAPEAYSYYLNQLKKYWAKQEVYYKAMAAIILFRKNEKNIAENIIRSLKEFSVNSEELGTYWPSTQNRYSRFSDVEKQSLLINAFIEVAKDYSSADRMKLWLLKNKQTNMWPTSQATAEACYAILNSKENIVNNNSTVSISLGNEKINEKTGISVVKKTFTGDQVVPNMGNINVKVNNSTRNSISWGAVYWQYFEETDKIVKSSNSGLSVQKKILVEINTPSGPVLKDATNIAKGDKVVIRLVVKADRDFEFVHLKDERSSGVEPSETLSGYKFSDNLFYYQSTLDASTNFFISYLPKGTYVFEYSAFANQKGDFSNGSATIQCLYAPEFKANTQGSRITIEPLQ